MKSLSEIPPFNHTGAKLSEVHKTGLGSSAALITSLVTCLLIRFAVISKSDLDPEPKQKKDKEILDGLTLAHNLAQYVHCFAQGKVGSGFDVSSAVYGSHIYKRFKPDVLTPLMDDSV
jgi:phosphomevalonate kinase